MSSRSNLIVILHLLIAILLFPTSGRTDDSAAFSGHWEGAIDIPGMSLGLKVDLAHDGTSWKGTIDIPMQGAAGLPLTIKHVDGIAIEFAIAGVPGDPLFKGSLAGGEIKGTFTQGGQTFPFHLGREAGAGMARPQEPQPPFPYATHEVTFQSGALTIAGALTIPSGAGPFPAILLISGSGAQNRDEEILGHKPFLVLADHLTRAGIAVLRTDDRGVGGSTGQLSQATTADLAGDALAGVDFLESRPEIAPERIGLLGHSEGAVVAPLAASRSDRVAFVIMAAGTGVTGAEILTRQTELLLIAGGVAAATRAQILHEHGAAVDLVRSGADSARVHDQLERLINAQMAANSLEEEPDPRQIEMLVRETCRSMRSPWFEFFLVYDPLPALRKVNVPVLVLSGELDLQVEPDQNLPGVERALAEGGNEDVTIHRFPGLNHLFQKAETGAFAEYATITETINPVVLDTVADWLGARFK